MRKAGQLAFRLVGVSAGLVLRVVDEINALVHGETEAQYLARKYPNLVVRDWTDGSF